ncbi:MAG TPA: aminodeoxychorismate lyase [Steroidobacteraceae bacterium]|nr:aminodeoxychorismate lyase [Steroidobacteraceae bacterium]
MNAAAGAPLELLVDGVACTASWPLDRGLLYGDGLFETMRVTGGRIRFEADHRARLAEGCRRLAIHADLQRIWSAAVATAARHGEATLRLQVTRGEAVARGYVPTGSETPRALLAAYAPPAPDELPARIRVVSLAQQLGEIPALAGLKHCNRLEQVLARLALRAAAPQAFEGLMASSSGRLVSGTMSNVFLELDGELVTPALDRCGVAGVLRAATLREAAATGTDIRVAELPFDCLARCTAVALSNARMGLVNAHELDGRPLPGSVRLAELAARMSRT